VNDMNWAAVSAIISAITLIGVCGVGGIMWGSLTERVSGLSKRADGHKIEIAEHAQHLSQHDVQLGRLEEWKAGYNAAARTGGHTPEI
jgi:hypothetical protein